MVIGLRAQLGEFNLPSITVAGVDVPLLTNTAVRNLGVMFHLRYDSECTGRKYHQSIISLTLVKQAKLSLLRIFSFRKSIISYSQACSDCHSELIIMILGLTLICQHCENAYRIIYRYFRHLILAECIL